MHLHAEERDRAVDPLRGQLLAADALDVDLVERTGDGVESGGVDDDVEIEVFGAGLYAGGGDPLDRRLADVNKLDVVAVVHLEVVGFERHPLHTEAVIFGDQLLGDHGVVDPSASPFGDVHRELGVGFFVEEDLPEVLQPNAETGLLIQPVPQRNPLLTGHRPETATVGLVLEATRGAGTLLKDLVVARPDVGHLGVGDRAVVERRTPVGPTLEDLQLADLVGDVGDHLNARGSGADHGDLLASQFDRLLGPVERVEGLSLEAVHPLETRRCWDRQQTQSGDHEPAGHFATVFQRQHPTTLRLVEAHGFDFGVELHVFAQVELVSHVVEVAKVLRLAGKPLLPVPLLKQFLGE